MVVTSVPLYYAVPPAVSDSGQFGPVQPDVLRGLEGSWEWVRVGAIPDQFGPALGCCVLPKDLCFPCHGVGSVHRWICRLRNCQFFSNGGRFV